MVQFWKIDSWDDERASLLADKQEIWGMNYGVSNSISKDLILSLCGNSGWKDQVTNIDVEIPHSSSQLVLEFRTTLDQGANDEAWGVRQLYLFTAKCADGCFDCTGNRK
jgi:hypothetical protein